MLWLAAAALATGLILLTLGLVGRRIDDHPVCRKCRFDLVGIAGPSNARCPECGADLSRPRSTRTGNRTRRRAPLIIGLALLLLTLVPSGIVGYQFARGRNPDTLKPEWWLLRDLESPTRADAALMAFDRRLAAGSLSRSGRLAVVRRILARQADTSRSWGPAWGAFVESAHADGQTSDQDWASYVRYAAVFAIDARPTVRQGDGPAAILRVRTRAGPSYKLTFQARCDNLDIGGASVAPGGMFTLNGILMSQAMPWGAKPLHNCVFLPKTPPENFIPEYIQAYSSPDEPHDRPVTAAPGQHRLTGTWTIRLFDNGGTLAGGVTATWGWHSTAQPVGWQLNPTGTPLVEYTVELSAPVTVVGPETDTVELVTDEALASTMKGSITASLYRDDSGQARVQGTLAPTNLPVDVAADVILVEDGRERKTGLVVLRSGFAGTQTGLDLGRIKEGSAASFILRPNPELARKTVELTRIWGRDIRIENVHIAPNPPWGPRTPQPQGGKP